jgi:hypothetical protein
MRSPYLKALLVGSLFALPAGVILIHELSWPEVGLLQTNHFYLGTDFVNYWSGGRLALQGRVDIVYDLPRYFAILRQWFSPELRGMNFSYPPHALMLFAGFGAFPYLAALALWSLAGVAAFIWVALGRAPRRGDGMLLWAIVLSPVVCTNVVLGQLGLLLAALFVGAMRALPTRPILAGVMIGALTIKPQFGLLLPLVLILLPSWRALAAATLSALVLVLLSLVAFGVEPWRVYIAETMPFQWHFVEVMDGFYRFQMTTPYVVAWFAGLSVKAALVVQWVIALLVAVATGATIRSDAGWPLKAAVVAFGSVLMVPYVLAYDLAIPLAALVWYVREGEVRADAAGLLIVGVTWALPFGLGTLLQTRGLPLLPIMLLICYAWLVAQALGWRWLGLKRPATASLKT